MTEVLLHRFSVADYHRMGENGTLAPDARVELLDGQIIDMFPIGPFHNSTIYWLTRQLSAAENGRWLTFPQCSLNLSEYSEPQPDFALLRPRKGRYGRELPTPKDVFLLIEVSDSSLVLDRRKKLPAYAAAGIPEVWIVNVPQQVVEVFRKPEPAGFAEHIIVQIGESFGPQAFPDFVLKTAELFELD